MTETAIYARISEDRDGDAAGVGRQVEDALALAEARGFTVADRFIDNDRSAYNGRTRPEWERLLAELQAGHVTHVIAWANDRLYYFDKESGKKYHKEICTKKKQGEVKGTVSKDGEKMIITVTELKFAD